MIEGALMPQPLRILHFEDSEQDAELIKENLLAAGVECAVTLAKDKEAFAAALKGKWDIILSDYNIPGFDGIAALELVRSSGFDVPFILISGTIGEEHAIDSLKQGATDYVLKDNLSRLATSVERALKEVEVVDRRKQAEIALVQSEENYRTLVSSMLDGVVRIDRDGVIVFASIRFCSMFGYELKEILGHVIYDVVFAKEQRDEAAERRRRRGEQGEERYETRCRHKDGHLIWMEIGVSAISDEKGNIDGFVKTFTDITTAKAAEEALQQSEQNFRSLLDATPDSLVIVDDKGNITQANKRTFQMFGYGEDDLLGKPIELLIPERFHKKHVAHRSKYLRDLKSRQMGIGLDLHALRNDGKEFPVEISLSYQRRGTSIIVLAAIRDVSERKLLEEQFLRAQRLESIGTLAGGIAHDLNNVLGPILLSLEVMRKRIPDKSIQRMIDIIAASAKRGADLIKQVLSFARGIKGEHVAVQIRHLIGEIETIIKETFPKSITVSTRVPKDLWTVTGDATQLHQVLMNLCVNARDALPEGGRIEIAVTNVELDNQYVRMHLEAKTGRYLRIEITDNGTGIPPKVKEKIFEPFFTTKEIGKGTGLGLSTVVNVVKSHGGFINVYSEMGRGTTFTVHLPAEGIGGEDQFSEMVDLEAGGNGEMILVVDDEEAVREITRTTLEAFGYSVLTATDGTDAISTYAQHKDTIDLVITDMMMPYMDGVATIRALRKMNPGIRILAVSGLQQDGHSTRDLQNVVFLHKPYTSHRLLESIRSIIGATDLH